MNPKTQILKNTNTKKNTILNKYLQIIIALLLLTSVAQAVTIVVTGSDGTIADDGICTISEAIISANSDSASGVMSGECVAGSGADSIELTSDITLIAENINGTFGRTGTPRITSDIILNGKGFTLQRDNSLTCTNDDISDAGEFRLLLIVSGNLDLHNITLRYGCVQGTILSSKVIGAGIYNHFGTLSIQNSQIIDNRALRAGGIFNVGIIASINSSIISGNSVNENGGGIFDQGTINDITNSVFSNNIASRGAGIYGFSGTINSIQTSTFMGNNALHHGGGIYKQNGSITTISNSTFSNNHAGNGGGIYIQSGASVSTIANTTFSANSASDSATTFGGGILNRGTISFITNSLFYENFNQGADCYNSGGTVAGSNNLSNQTATNCTNAGITSTLSMNTVAPLANNGCITPLADGTCVMTHALLVGSEAIDDALDGLLTDQRSFVANDGFRDIGAYELLTPENQCTQNGMDTSVRFVINVQSVFELNTAITCANANEATVDIINLTQDIIINTHYDDVVITFNGSPLDIGRTGTAAITSGIEIDGKGYILARDPANACLLNNTKDIGEFRLMRLQSSTAHLRLRNIVLEGGCADGPEVHNGIAGGIYIHGGALNIDNSALNNNQATNVAGGIYLIASSSLLDLVTNSTFNANQSGRGGAIYSNGVIAGIKNSTFSGNIATGYLGNAQGGAIWNNHTIFDLHNNTFSANQAINSTQEGGAIYLSANTTTTGMTNNLFHENSATINADCYLATGGALAGSSNLSDQDSHSCPSANIATTLLTSSIGPLTDNGCITPLADGTCVMTHALLADSESAIDMGDSNATATDQRGFFANATRDIGAFEYDGINDIIFKNGFE